MMCQVDYSKCNTRAGDVDSERGCACVRGQGICENSLTSQTETALKSKVCFFRSIY